MTPAELLLWITAANNIVDFITSKINQYRADHNNATDDQIRQHLKDLNAADAAGFDRIIALSNAQMTAAEIGKPV